VISVPFWLEVREVVEDCSLVAFETVEVDVGEVEETSVLVEGADGELIDETDEELTGETSEEVVLSVRVTVELVIVDDDEAIVGPKEDVMGTVEPEEGADPDEGPGDVELRACRPTAETSIRMVSTTATATTA
jgi:hypothetical protein